MKKRIAVLFGGSSSEHAISLQSAHAVISNLDRNSLDVVMVGITREGKWFHYTGDVDKIADGRWEEEISHCIPAFIAPDRSIHGLVEWQEDHPVVYHLDMALPIMHGKNGEDGTIQGLIELAGIRLIGCDTLCSALCMDKYRAHEIVRSCGIQVPLSLVIERIASEEVIWEAIEEMQYPLFVKPVRAGSSIGITKVLQKEHLMEAITKAFQYDEEVIIEENVEGFEVGCAILGRDCLTVGEVDEIELRQGFFDFKEKYSLGKSKIHMPARLDEETRQYVKEVAKSIYRVLGCRDFARVDLFVTPQKEIVFNEVNTIPGFTAHSRYPNMMKGMGLSFQELLKEIIHGEDV